MMATDASVFITAIVSVCATLCFTAYWILHFRDRRK